jgi:hypothetical protein
LVPRSFSFSFSIHSKISKSDQITMGNPKLNRDMLKLHNIDFVEQCGGDEKMMPQHVQRIMEGLLDFRSIIPAEDKLVRAPGLLPLQESDDIHRG